MYNYNLLLIALTLLSIGSALSAPIQWTVASGGNNHYYDIQSTTTTNFDDALLWATKFTNIPGYTSHAAHLNTQEEADFVKANVPSSQSLFLGSQRDPFDIWAYGLGGSDQGQVWFNQQSGQCYGYCVWADDQPSPSKGGTLRMSTSTPPTFSSVEYLGGYFLIEYTPVNEPYVSPPMTSGGSVSVRTNNYGFDAATVQVSITKAGGNPQPCVSTSSIVSGNFNCTMPSGDGKASITIKDSAATPKTWTNTNYRYQLPHATIIYPSLAVNSLLTVVGDNFGDSNSAITVTIGISKSACINPTFLTNHLIFTCQLTAAISQSAPLLPIAIKVGSTGVVYSTSKVYFYDKENLRAIRICPGLGSWKQSMFGFKSASQPMIIDGNKVYNGVPQTSAQLTLMATMFSSVPNLCVGLMGRNLFSSGLGPQEGLEVVDSLGKCRGIYCNNGNYDSNTNPDSVNYFKFSTYTYVNVIDSYPEYICGELSFLGSDPVPLSMSNVLVPTSGGVATVNFKPINGIGFLYTPRTVKINGALYPATLTPNFATAQLSFPMTPGSGAAKPSVFTFEGKSITGPSIGYMPPSISSIKPPTTIGGVVTLYGSNFGANVGAISVSVADQPCTSLSLPTAHATIMCSVGPGTGSNIPMTITVDGQSTSDFTFNYAPPVITSITQSGTTLTMLGSSFGTVLLDISTNIPGASVTSIVTTPDPLINQITVTIPFNTLNAAITVSTKGQTSTAYSFQYVPVLIAVASVPSTSGDVITVTGQFLNSKRKNDSPTIITATANDLPCISPSAWADASLTYVSCIVAPGTGRGRSISVTIDGKSSNILPTLNYAPPSLSAFTQNMTVATISGLNFGTNANVITVSFNGGPNQPASAIVTNHTAISVSIPVGTLNGGLTVRVDGQTSPSIAFSLVPAISSATAIPTRGGSMVITGSYFNSQNFAGATLALAVTLGGQTCSQPTILSPSLITCVGPAGTGAANTLDVSIDNRHGIFTYAYKAPSISNVNVDQTSITINGNDFGTNTNKITVAFPGGLQVTPDSVSDLVTPQVIIVNSIPANALNGQLYVTVDTLKSTPFAITLTPIVSSATAVPTSGDTTVITGTHFTSAQDNGAETSVQVTIGGKECMDAIVQSFTTIRCIAPAGTGLTSPLIVTIDGSPSISIAYSYQAPVLTSVSQSDQYMTFSGSNFGANTQVVSATFGTVASGLSSLANHLTAVISIPAFSLSGDVSITVDGQTSSTVPYVLTPILKTITTVDTTGGMIQIGGLFLNEKRQDGSKTTITAKFTSLSQNCTDITIMPSNAFYTFLNCTAPAGTGKNLPLEISIDGKTDVINFSYGGPSITTIIVSEANVITVTGRNFGVDKNIVSVTIGSISVTTFDLSATTITFLAPLNSFSDLVQVTVDERASNTILAQLYPILDTVSNSDTQGTLINITGSYLNYYKSGNVPTVVRVYVNNLPCANVFVPTTSNTWMTCTAPRGAGSNLMLDVFIESLKDSLVFAYNAPVVSSNTQSGNTIVLVGSNFGNDSSILVLSPAYTIVSVKDTAITATLPDKALNGPVTATVASQTSSPYTLNIQPSITNASPVSPYGGDITITGKFLNFRSKDTSETTITISIEGTTCTLVVNAPVDGSQFICTIGKQSFNHGVISVTIDGQQGSGDYSSLPPIITGSSSVYYLVGGDITITGDLFIEPLQVNVSDSICASPVLITPQSIKCHYDGSATPLIAGLPVTVVAGQLQATATVFNYTIDSCPSSCNGHGTCFSGLCKCDAGFSGSQCDIVVVGPIIPSPGEGNVTFPATNITFGAAIYSINEIDSTNTQVKQVLVSTLAWALLSTTSNDVSTTTTYSGSISSDTFQISIASAMFNSTSATLFAGQSIPNLPQSLKHTVTITNWVFSSPSNTLQVVYRSTFPTQSIFDCGNTTSVATFSTDASTALKALTIDTPYGVYVASFSNRVISDSSVSILNISMVEQAADQATGISHVDIALFIPHFANEAVYDPTFTANTKSLPQRTRDDCPRESSKKKKKSWVIPVAVVLSIIGAALIGTGAYLIYRKKKQGQDSSIKMK
eukprot:gene13432-15830_t